MQAIILAAGRGTRMGHLTDTMPKPMLLYKGRNLLEHKFDSLPDSVDEVVMVVGYLKEKIVEYFGDSYKGKKITYVDLPEIVGTASAVTYCESYMHDSFLVLMGDDIYTKEDIRAAIDSPSEWTITVKKFDEARRGGVTLSPQGFFETIDEESALKGPTVVSTGMFKLDMKYFKYDPVKIPGKTEYGLPHTVLSAKSDIKTKILYATGEWLQITAPEDVDPIQNL